MSPIELCWNITSYISIIVQLIAAGVCFGVFVLPYMQGRDKAVKTGSVYGVVMTVLYIMPPQIDNILAYFIGTVAAFAVMYVEDRQNINTKNIFVGHFLYAALAVLFYGRDYRFLSGYCSFQFGDSGDVMAALWTVCNDKNYGYTVLFATFAVVHSGCQ